VNIFEASIMRNRMLKMTLLRDSSEQCNETNPQLGLDEACLQVISSASDPLTLWVQSQECDKVN
jgi:hypothetical protein